ncbi:MAG: hypothetical protein NC548_22950 [Lachnospiraceae bacterium]|nr:hypothetical protein [Lachnospiraceae bacterium]
MTLLAITIGMIDKDISEVQELLDEENGGYHGFETEEEYEARGERVTELFNERDALINLRYRILSFVS